MPAARHNLIVKFASATTVSPEKTRAEIETLVSKHGAVKFVSGWEESGAAVLFEMRGRRVRFTLPMPDRKAKQFTRSSNGWERSSTDAQKRYEQAVRSAWRGLLLVIKAKLEAVESGIAVFDQEFLAHIVLPGTGETFGEWAMPRIAEAYDLGTSMPPLLHGKP